MAIKLSANYSKKLGLPQYSSHSFSASVEIELTDITQVEAEVKKLYTLLQQSVDQEIQHPGFVPEANGHSTNGNGNHQRNGNSRQSNGEHWNCTEGQRGFILRLVNENNLDKQEVENLSQQLFQVGVKQLNRMQASQLIEELLAKAGKASGQSRWRRPQNQPA